MATKEDVAVSDFAKKWTKKLAPEQQETLSKIEAMSDSELKDRLVKCQQAISQTELEIENDSKIQSLKEDLRENLLPFKEAIGFLKAEMRMAAFVLEGRGK